MAKRPSSSRALTPEVIDAAPVNPDVALVQTEGAVVTQFFLNLAVFFRKATEMEQQAKAELADVKASWKKPTSLDEDQRLVSLLRQNTQARKTAEEHFGIKTAFHRLHKIFTTAEGRVVTVRTEIDTIGNRLHNAYVQEERFRAQQESDRLRREEEARAQQARDAELAEIERKAIEAEKNSPDLSPRELRAVDYYVSSENWVSAARNAGYKNPDESALRLSTSKKIQAAVQAKRDAITLRQQAAAKAAAPVIVEDTADVAPEIADTGRTTWSCEVYDEDAFMAVLLDPKQRLQYGVPSEAATYKQTVLNELARSLHEKIDRIPGIRHKKNTRVI